jgi:hypothetical protein
MPDNEPSARTHEPTASATEANSTIPPRRRNALNHFGIWARVVAGAVLAVSAVAVIFFAGFFTEEYYGDVLGAFEFAASEGFLAPEERCIQVACTPADRFGQHCRQVLVPC